VEELLKAVTVKFSYSSDDDQQLLRFLEDNFSFDFELLLNQDSDKKYKISEIINLKIDMSDYDMEM
jgi:hypothetical protein